MYDNSLMINEQLLYTYSYVTSLTVIAIHGCHVSIESRESNVWVKWMRASSMKIHLNCSATLLCKKREKV